MKKEKEIIRYNPDKTFGLTEEELTERKKNKIYNTVKDENSKSYLQIVLSNIFTFFNILMIGLAIALILIVGIEIITNLSYLIVLFFNTIIAIFQECRSKRTLAKLKLLNESKIEAIRNGVKSQIYASEITLDDILILKPGDQVPADCIILDGRGTEVNESLLTGESRAVKKGKGDLLLAGSYIISGSITVKADKIGKDTYLHSIEEKAKGYEKPKSKLIISINKIIKTLASIAIPLAIIVFWNEYLKNGLDAATKWGSFTIMYMIPAGMLLLSTVAMSVGVVNLSAKKVLTQDIYSVETLSRIDTICLDKTGTLTDGTMTIEDTIAFDEIDLPKIMSTYLSAFEYENQTSKALVNKYGKTQYYEVTNTVEFSSDRKYSAVEINYEDLYILGAPEYICNDQEILNKAKEYAKVGLRVVVLIKAIGKFSDDELPKKRIPVAMFVIRDNIRAEVKLAMEWFAKNDVDIKVISGDNIGTVSYIAKQCGINNWDKAIDLSIVDEKDFEETVLNNSIFGRVTPEQKAQIVDILQSHGKTVGMTGDGINDIVALKKADCSIALSNGAPATKNIANLVLMDSNFANMKEAVFEGRRVVNNIQRSSILFIMKDFLWLFTMLAPLLFGISHIYEPTIMTLVNIMITGISSFLLSIEPNKEKIQGNFVKNILGKAICSAFYMFLPMLFIIIYAFIVNGASDTEAVENTLRTFTPVISLCITIDGFVIFYKLCKPFSTFRRFVFIIILACTVLLLLAIPDFFMRNGTEYIKELISTGNIQDIIHTIISSIFSLTIYKEFTGTEWIIVGIFTGLSFILYYLTDKYVSKFLNITMFNEDKFKD